MSLLLHLPSRELPNLGRDFWRALRSADCKGLHHHLWLPKVSEMQVPFSTGEDSHGWNSFAFLDPCVHLLQKGGRLSQAATTLLGY